MEKSLKDKPKQKILAVSPEHRQLAADIKSAKKETGQPGARTRLALFLGAGASIQSGVTGTGGMIRHFKQEIFKIAGIETKSEKEKEEWLAQQEWYKPKESDYCKCFKKCYPTEAKRRSYIESIIEKAEPKAGYIILANLIKYGYINTIVTTNFDDLVYIACTTYTDMRPVVYSLGGFASEMTVSSERSRVLKLHGDFLYSSLKNTGKELKKQDQNMKEQVQKILQEYDGLIVVGYSGGDDSVMDMLENIPDGKTFYWCDLDENYLSQRARKAIANKEGIFVKTEGFIELMHIIREEIGISYDDIISTFTERQKAIQNEFSELDSIVLEGEQPADSSFREKLEDANEILKLHLQSVKDFENKQFKKAELAIRKIIELKSDDHEAHNNLGILLSDDGRTKEAEEEYREAIRLKPDYPNAHNGLGILLSKDRRTKEAEEELREAIRINPDDMDAHYNLALVLKNDGRIKEAEEEFREAIRINPDDHEAHSGLGTLLRSQGRLDEALKISLTAINLHLSNAVLFMNLAALYKEKGDKKNFLHYAKEAEKLLEPDEYYNRACLYAILEKKDEAFENLKIALDKGKITKVHVRNDPDWKWIKDDPRFEELMGGE